MQKTLNMFEWLYSFLTYFVPSIYKSNFYCLKKGGKTSWISLKNTYKEVLFHFLSVKFPLLLWKKINSFPSMQKVFIENHFQRCNIKKGRTFLQSKWEQGSWGFQWCPFMMAVVSIPQVMAVETLHLKVSCLRKTSSSVGLILMCFYISNLITQKTFFSNSLLAILSNLECHLLEKLDLCVGGTEVLGLKWSRT